MVKTTKRKTPIYGARRMSTSRHQTSDDHDHVYIISNQKIYFKCDSIYLLIRFINAKKKLGKNLSTKLRYQVY